MAKLSKKELESIQKLMNDFNQVKMQLGDTVITQHSLMSNVEELKVAYAKEEQKLIKKYGEKSLVSYLNGPSGRNVYSLGFLHNSKKFVLITKFVEAGVAKRSEEVKIEAKKPKKVIEISEDVEYKPRTKKKKKTLMSKLRDTDGKKENS